MIKNKQAKVSDLVRRCFEAWETSDRAMLEALLADDFTFTSPNDDHISRAEYWETCWPGREKIQAIRIEKLVEQGDEAFVRYECQLTDGTRFRNVEYFKFDGARIKGVEVYFGRNL